MKILLVQSFLGGFQPVVYPLGLTYLTAALSGHEVHILDLNVVDEPYQELPRRIGELAPDLIGLSLRNIDNQMRLDFSYFYRDHFQRELKIIRRAAPATTLVAGGAGFSLFPREIMAENPELDFGVYLEGEETFPELLANLDRPQGVAGVYYREDGEVRFTGNRPLVDFARLPPPDHRLLKDHAYTLIQGVGIQTTRGCPHNCVYCVYPKLGGRSLRSRPAAEVVREIEGLLGDYGLDNFFFADSAFGADLQQGKEICRLILSKGLKVRWGAYFDLEYADADFFHLCRKAGCEAYYFSPDGYSAEALRALGKGITPRLVKQNLDLFLNDPELARATVIYTVFLNSPGETLSGLGRTLWLWARTYPRLKLKRRGDMALCWIRIEPETRLHRLAIEQNDLTPGQSLLPPAGGDYAELFYHHPRLRVVEGLLLGLMRSLGRLKDLLKKLLGKGRGQGAAA